MPIGLSKIFTVQITLHRGVKKMNALGYPL